MAEELGQKADALEQALVRVPATDGADSGAGKTVRG
jgi:hypothetical protein